MNADKKEGSFAVPGDKVLKRQLQPLGASSPDNLVKLPAAATIEF